MSYNPYWSVYKNLERELLDLSNLIHIDDDQLKIYSTKISELLIRTVVEIESISKKLYFLNGGTKPDDNELFFDTDCLALLENKWQLSKKQLLISAPNFYLNLDENNILTPLKKADKRGKSSSDWQKAYQAIKHNRVTALTEGNLKHLIRAMGSLFILNLYFKDTVYELEKDNKGTNFDNGLGSSVFSVRLHISAGISFDKDYTKNPDFDDCIYLLTPTSETRKIAQEAVKIFNDKANERTRSNILDEMNKQLSSIQISNQDELPKKLESIAEKAEIDIFKQVAKENGELLRKAFEELKYEAILNKKQF
jgi:hypothetical protein